MGEGHKAGADFMIGAAKGVAAPRPVVSLLPSEVLRQALSMPIRLLSTQSIETQVEILMEQRNSLIMLSY